MKWYGMFWEGLLIDKDWYGLPLVGGGGNSMHHRLGSASFRSLLGGFPWWVPVHSLVHHGRVFTRLFVERGPLTRIFNSSPVPFLRQPAFLCDFEVVGVPWAPSGHHLAPSLIFRWIWGGILEAMGHRLGANGVKRGAKIAQRCHLRGFQDTV